MKGLTTKTMILASLFGALSYISGLFRVPIGPVPVTLQTAVIILAGLLLPSSAAFFSQVIHFLLLFLLSGGTALFLAPSFGFIIGFMVAAPMLALLSHRRTHWWQLGVIALIGEVLFYAVGIPYMAYILLSVKGMTLDLMGLLNIGLIPFIVPDVVKLVIAVLIASRLKKQLHL